MKSGEALHFPCTGGDCRGDPPKRPTRRGPGLRDLRALPAIRRPLHRLGINRRCLLQGRRHDLVKSFIAPATVDGRAAGGRLAKPRPGRSGGIQGAFRVYACRWAPRLLHPRPPAPTLRGRRPRGLQLATGNYSSVVTTKGEKGATGMDGAGIEARTAGRGHRTGRGGGAPICRFIVIFLCPRSTFETTLWPFPS